MEEDCHRFHRCGSNERRVGGCCSSGSSQASSWPLCHSYRSCRSARGNTRTSLSRERVQRDIHLRAIRNGLAAMYRKSRSQAAALFELIEWRVEAFEQRSRLDEADRATALQCVDCELPGFLLDQGSNGTFSRARPRLVPRLVRHGVEQFFVRLARVHWARPIAEFAGRQYRSGYRKAPSVNAPIVLPSVRWFGGGIDHAGRENKLRSHSQDADHADATSHAPECMCGIGTMIGCVPEYRSYATRWMVQDG